jgi:hypothetical protein
VICGAGDVQLLAAALVKDPKMAAVIEAAMRAAGVQLMPESDATVGGPLESAGYAAALMNLEGQRVLLALLGALTGRFSAPPEAVGSTSSSSSSGGSSNAAARQHAAVTAGQAAAALSLTAAGAAGRPQAQHQQQQQSQMLASLLTTCLKASVARVAWLSEQQQQAGNDSVEAKQLRKNFSPGALNQAAVVAELCCLLGGTSTARGSSGCSSSTASTSSSRAGSSSSSSSSSSKDSAVDRIRQWLALAGKSLALLCQWLAPVDKGVLEQAALVDDGPDAAWRVLQDVGGLLPLGDLLRICSSTLDWLGQQLAAVGLPGLGGLQAEAGQQQDAAARQAARKLAKQQEAAAQKLAEATAALQAVRASIRFLQVPAADGSVRMVRAVLGGSSDLEAVRDSAGAPGRLDLKSCMLLQDSLASTWAALGEFAGNLVAQCPDANSCGNPSCVGFGMLSEKKLVAAKKTQCSKCKAVRYCSRECQLQMWEQHRPVCKRLRAAGATSGV